MRRCDNKMETDHGNTYLTIAYNGFARGSIRIDSIETAQDIVDILSEWIAEQRLNKNRLATMRKIDNGKWLNFPEIKELLQASHNKQSTPCLHETGSTVKEDRGPE